MRRSIVLPTLSLCALVLASTRLRADPPCYTKKDTWQETMRASLDALVRQEAEAAKAAAAEVEASPFEPFGAEVRLGREPRFLRVPVAGLRRLCLRTRNLVSRRRGRGTVCFGTPRLVTADGKSVPVTLKRPLFIAAYGHRDIRDERDRRWREAKLGDHFATGFLMARETEALFQLDGNYEWFEAWLCAHPSECISEDRMQLLGDVRPTYKRRDRRNDGRKAIRDLVRRDFADPCLVHEQDIESRHGIWRNGWPLGDVAQLAARYARGCDSNVKQRASGIAKTAKTAADLAAVRSLFYLRHARERLAFARKTLEFVERVAARPRLTAELAELERMVEKADELPVSELSGLHVRALRLRRRIILSHPLLDFDRLLINKRPLPRYNHMCDQYLGRHSGIGPGLIVLENWKHNPKETVLLAGKLPPGSVLHPDLSFDAKRVLFSYCDHTQKRADYRRFWIYEIGVDGTGLRQLTGTPNDPRDGWGGRQTVLIEDWDPCYLPDGGFAFISSRSQTFGRCHGSRYVPTYMLFRANADGSGIRQLSFGEANEWDPSVLHDGRIIYTRWDYINRHDTNFQSVWVTRPDGTATAHFYGNYSVGPCMIAEARAIAGSHKVVATATDHHGHTGGSIIVIDPHRGQDGGEPLTAVTPELGFPERGAPRGTTMTARPPYQRGRRAATPYPLSEDLFLVAYQQESRYAVYLTDTLGGRELIYSDPNASCFAPIPIRPTQRPPVLQSPVASKQDTNSGIFYVQAVHRSVQPIEPGSIKRLRINRIYGQPTRSKPALSLANNEVIKGIVGTVPVNDDGSVAFRAPAGVPLQLQALDENGMAVMTMRSLIYLQPGEAVSCVGCHEPRSAAPTQALPLTLQVRDLEPPAGPRYKGGFSFTRTVQPVLDRHCIRCHGLEKTEGNVNLLGTRTRYSQAHDTLTSRRGWVAIAYRNRESAFSRPKDYFAHAGRLATYLLNEHSKHVKLDRDSFQRIVDWLDLNAQFYGDYSHNRVEHRRPSREGEKALREHIAKTFGHELAKQPFEALVNIALPTQSRILNAPLAVEAGGWGQMKNNAWGSTNAPGYKKMLALVEASITPLKEHDIAGTCGHAKRCRCGSCWVRKLREETAQKP